ncbi:CpaF family protein, partial [Burkholderia cepacia]|nr:CpaF family protein [Burkholderia cepacia]
MSLREQMSLQRAQPPLATGSEPTGPAHSSVRDAYQKLRREIHLAVLERVELERLSRMPQESVRTEIGLLITRILDDERMPANDIERRQLAIDVYDEMFGFGPLEALLRDPTVSDILVNTYRQVYVERFGQLELTDVTFYDDAHLMKVIEKIVSRVGRRIDESSPMVDARLPDGSRVNAIIPPSAIDGPLMSIRRFAVNPLKMDDLVRYHSLTPPMAELLDALSRAKVNVLVSGGTGSGETT